jgi:protein TonB
MLIKEVEPIYPVGAKATGKSGMVVVRATIGKDGNILNPVAVVSTDYSFSVAAVEAVKHWKYKPFLLNGEPVEVLTMIYVYFGR